MALEEERANSADVDDAAISGVKIGMMGPLAGAGDPLFWFTLRPILLSLGASLAVSGNILGPLLFFILWNIMAAAVKWYTQEFGYKAGVSITDDLSGGLLQKVTRGASMMGMFVIGSLIQRWSRSHLRQSCPKSNNKKVPISNGINFLQVLRD